MNRIWIALTSRLRKESAGGHSSGFIIDREIAQLDPGSTLEFLL